MNLSINKTELKTIDYKNSISVGNTSFTRREVLAIEFSADGQAFKTELNLVEGFHLTTYKEALELFETPTDYLKWPEEVKYAFEVAIFKAHYLEKLNDKIYISPYSDPSHGPNAPALAYAKVKLGRQSIAKDQEFLKSLSSPKPRLDANKTLEFESFKELAKVSKDYDYFEDPFINPKLMINFPHERFALDESVLDDELWKLKQVTTFVLKPSALGLGNTIELIKLAKQLKKRVVISSTFESEQGHQTLAALAAYSDMALGYREHHGLGTISLLKAPLTWCQIEIKDLSAELKFKS